MISLKSLLEPKVDILNIGSGKPLGFLLKYTDMSKLFFKPADENRGYLL